MFQHPSHRLWRKVTEKVKHPANLLFLVKWHEQETLHRHRHVSFSWPLGMPALWISLGLSIPMFRLAQQYFSHCQSTTSIHGYAPILVSWYDYYYKILSLYTHGLAWTTSPSDTDLYQAYNGSHTELTTPLHHTLPPPCPIPKEDVTQVFGCWREQREDQDSLWIWHVCTSGITSHTDKIRMETFLCGHKC